MAGLQRVAGNRALYRKLLLALRVDHGDDVRRLRGMLRSGDDEAAQRLAHALKGVMGTIGATSVAARVGDVEALLKTGRRDEAAIAVEGFAAVFAPLVEAIASLAPPTEPQRAASPPVFVSPAELERRFNELRGLLDEMAADAAERAADLVAVIVDSQVSTRGSPDAVRLASRLREATESFAFQEALEILDALRGIVLRDETQGTE